ncbi:heat shock 70 kDa protein 12A-like, partial [Magallana gigas]|uniref:heat shock 70 kDa protein 12A-like n=1 Tax=Magallana gigas TaxID=29159 RepID=UPI00333ECF9E
LTVPAIWTDSAKQFIREAAREAGIHDDQLMLAYEPEAAALYCRLLPIDRFGSGGEHQELVLKTFERGKKFMVIDLGDGLSFFSGGTVDVSVQEITDTGKMKSIYNVCGGPWGGTRVDEEFTQFLIKLLEQMCLLSSRLSVGLNTWNSMKRVVLKISPALVDILSERSGEEFEEKFKTLQQNKALSFSGDKLNIDNSLFASFFKSSMNEINSHIEDIFNADNCRDLVVVVMVGGISERMFFISAVKKAFPHRKFIIPMEAGSVAKGAVLFGYDPDIIFSRTCRYTYGHDIGVPFDISIHPQERGKL